MQRERVGRPLVGQPHVTVEGALDRGDAGLHGRLERVRAGLLQPLAAGIVRTSTAGSVSAS
jgi:hypothetical protein